VAGKPDSFFREESLQFWADHWTLSGDRDPALASFSTDYMAAMRSEGRGGTDMFGMRLMGPDLTYACDWLRRLHPGRSDDKALFDAAFGPTVFIHLSRQDKLAEAVSYLRAEQSGLWHANTDGSDRERIPPVAAQGYDATAIASRMAMLTRHDTHWPTWFAKHNITPMKLNYEALALDPLAMLGDVLTYLGLDPAFAARARPSLRKLADATSAAWIARFRAENDQP
jgi:LPS sulfotransferase NodH